MITTWMWVRDRLLTARGIEDGGVTPRVCKDMARDGEGPGQSRGKYLGLQIVMVLESSISMPLT